ncbi:MAG: molybdopterin molybdotransferase MoeA [Candidatus Nanopelagicales bacterium]
MSTASVSGVLPWTQARLVARTAAEPLPVVTARLDEAVGSVLAEPLHALTDLPPFDSAAMDGWAVAGRGPWHADTSPDAASVLAGADRTALPDGHAVPIATGAVLPEGATAVLRREQAVLEQARDGARLLALDPLTGIPGDGSSLAAGTDVRARGEECGDGDFLVPAGVVVTPAVLGLAAAAGYDGLPVVRTPVVGVLVLGDELLERGLPRAGKVRDALGPLVPAWMAGLGARGNPPVRVPDSRQALLEEIEDANVDVLVTTGSTARGPVDHLHDVLTHLRARWIVDGVSVRPGHPMLLARLPDGRFVLGLPGNPLAAVSGLATLAGPLVAGLRGDPDAEQRGIVDAVLTEDVPAHPHDTRLVPVQLDPGDVTTLAAPLRFTGPAMLRGLALGDGLAVVPPGTGQRGSRVEVLPVPAAG